MPRTDSTILAIELSQTALRALPRNVLDPDANIVAACFHNLAAGAFRGPDAPKLVLSPLVTPVFDVIELARMMQAEGFLGRYLGLARQVPNAALIRRDVALHAPDVNFNLVLLDGPSPLHSV